MSATTSNSPSKQKQIDKMIKPESMEEARHHRQKEEGHERLIKEIKQDVKEIKDEPNEMRNRIVSSSVRDDSESRAVRIERRLAEQEQYTKRECVDIVGLPENLKRKDLEATVPMEKRDVHAIHRLYNNKVVIYSLVIAKVCNRRDVITILRSKMKFRELSQEGKKKFKSRRI